MKNTFEQTIKTKTEIEKWNVFFKIKNEMCWVWIWFIHDPLGCVAPNTAISDFWCRNKFTLSSDGSGFTMYLADITPSRLLLPNVVFYPW